MNNAEREQMMKKQFNVWLCAVTLLAVSVVFCACGRRQAESDLWATAVYTEDTELGTGTKTLYTKVTAGDKTITFTIHTDTETVGDALTEQKLVTGEQGAYGLYVKTVNGILADYEKTHSYWAFNQNGEAVQTGVSGESFDDGARYELVYTAAE